MSADGGLRGGMQDDQNQNQPTSPPTITNVRAASSGVVPAPAVVAPTSSPLASSMTTAENIDKPFPSDPTQTGSSLNNVQVENAYIPTNPPPAGAIETIPASKPTAASMVVAGDQDKLLDIKKQTLQSLAPLVDNLDQPPPEKFKILMMLIQASDNPQYIEDAFEAANKITDEKARAQALLDVVNEINYFTQKDK